jgi:nicotinamidase-related amidase
MTQAGSFDEAMEIYIKAGITGKVGFGKRPAIMVVDLTKGFTFPEFQIGTDLSEVVYNNLKLLKKARELELPVFFSVNEFREDMKDTGVWLKKFPSIITLKRGSEEVQIDSRLDPQPDEQVISKNFPSCFFGTTLATRLIALGIDTLIVTGTTTSGCVRATVVDSLQYGFRTIIPRECVGDRAQAPHEANLFDMGMKYADVVSLQEVMEYFDKLQ